MVPTAVSLLLAAGLSGNSPTFEWARSPASEGVLSYTIHWRSPATEWCAGYAATYVEPNNCGVAVCGDAEKCCGEVSNPERELGGTLLFFVVSASNASGDGETEHGGMGVCP